MSQHIVCVIRQSELQQTVLQCPDWFARQRVDAFLARVTVDKKAGNFEYRNEKIELVDPSGIYSITWRPPPVKMTRRP